MARGRKSAASDERVLLELLLYTDRAAFGPELAENLPVGDERVRQILSELEEDGFVDISKVGGSNVYRLTDAGFEHLTKYLRDNID